MPNANTTEFLAGVIEGFYGQPWSRTERLELFEWMVAWGLNAYLYAPKDDLKHRAVWRELYSSLEAESLSEVIQASKQRGIRFIYALGPGLDIRYSSETDLDHLKKRFQQMIALGCENFALLFDDIPDRMELADSERFGSFASAQCHVANIMFQWTRQRCPNARFLFCPTPYCGRMADRKLGGEGYLATIGRELLPGIDVFWTGPEIISREITAAHIRDLETLLRRKPLIWDNLHANDYDGRRFFCGPYSGRSLELRSMVTGFLCNPNSEFSLNYVPLRTFAAFVDCKEQPWNPREAYLAAIREWLPHFATINEPVEIEDLIFLCDCYYLPHEEGAEAQAFLECARSLLSRSLAKPENQVATFRRQVSRLRQLCARITELRHRPLFYALSRRIWELREELDLLERYLEYISKGGHPDGLFNSDAHLPGTFRGGMVPRLQRFLEQHPDGVFTPAYANSALQSNERTSPYGVFL